jgi:integrase
MTRHNIHKREGPHGVRWHACVSLGMDPLTGKQRQKRLSAPTKRELEGKIAELLVRVREGQPATDSTMPLATFLDQWLASVAASVKGGTLRTWRSRCRIWLVPELGAVRLKELTPRHVDRLMQRILAAGRSPSLANAVHGTLRTALATAVTWGLLSRNVCQSVTPPRMATPEMQTWSADEAAVAIAAAADDHQFGALWRLALTTGMRQGELLGLRWSDVDLERGVLSVRQTYARGATGALEVSTPKTARGRRSIALSTDDVAALRRHRTWQLEARLAAPAWREHDLVFCDRLGEPAHPNLLVKRFAQLIRQTGLPRIRFHDLRHSAATLMLASGEHPKIVSERLGHAHIGITLDRYSHVSETMQRDAAERLDGLLKRAAGERL